VFLVLVPYKKRFMQSAGNGTVIQNFILMPVKRELVYRINTVSLSVCLSPLYVLQ